MTSRNVAGDAASVSVPQLRQSMLYAARNLLLQSVILASTLGLTGCAATWSILGDRVTPKAAPHADPGCPSCGVPAGVVVAPPVPSATATVQTPVGAVPPNTQMTPQNPAVPSPLNAQPGVSQAQINAAFPSNNLAQVPNALQPGPAQIAPGSDPATMPQNSLPPYTFPAGASSAAHSNPSDQEVHLLYLSEQIENMRTLNQEQKMQNELLLSMLQRTQQDFNAEKANDIRRFQELQRMVLDIHSGGTPAAQPQGGAPSQLQPAPNSARIDYEDLPEIPLPAVNETP